ncbi:EthD family reductase [Sphingomonas sp. H39-1-10]|uniref:EthD family reductase n=1 Tax=Sphingomonas pollutisoli TaxID=3030829 RepID=UPI0023B921BC|nr:EthD family reductase [Sphingomonas pollutisoli]MDF0487827.1 EthD family reductase [Sphingomonas pollutisoli]
MEFSDRQLADMADQPDAVIVYVTYRGTVGTRFDKNYYVERHLPLVMRSWARYGLEGVTAFFPGAMQNGTIAICECRFRDEAAIAAAFASREADPVMADLERFTDVIPRRVRGIAL